MIQLQILSGKQAGNRWIARRFPVRVGRDAGNDLKLEEDGVWDRHCEVAFDRKKGFVLTAQPKALLTVNSEPMAEPYVLRNGDSFFAPMRLACSGFAQASNNRSSSSDSMG